MIVKPGTKDVNKNNSITNNLIHHVGRIMKMGAVDIPRVLNGLGIAIMSTSHGVMTGKQAKKENVGGEVLCYVY